MRTRLVSLLAGLSVVACSAAPRTATPSASEPTPPPPPAAPTAAQPPPLLAVLEFDGEEGVVADSELALLTDAMRGAVKKEVGAKFKVMTRETMLEIVPPEQLKCFAGKCVAEIGRMLQAPYVIAGNVKKLGSKRVLTTEAYESKGGQLLGSEQLRGANAEDLLDLLDKQARGLVRGWLNLGPSGASGPSVAVDVKPSVTESKLGGGVKSFSFSGGEEVVASFDSEPAGAIVLLDGQMLCPQTPCSREVAAGSHQVLMTMEGYDSAAQQVEVSAKQSRVRLKLPPNFALLSVTTTPSGLPITLDGKPIGTSPITDRRIDAKPHDVMVQDPCYADVGERIVVGKGEKRTVTLAAEPRWAGLRVKAADEQGNALVAEIEVDGQPMGTTPKNVKVPMCAKELKVSSGQRGATEKLSLREGEEKALPLVLKSLGPPPGVFKAAGREWQAEPSPQPLSWDDAKSYCARLSLAGGGWHLPDKDELKALYDAKGSLSDDGSAKETNSGWYWSSSPGGWSSHAWSVDFDRGGSDAHILRFDQHVVRCAR